MTMPVPETHGRDASTSIEELLLALLRHRRRVALLGVVLALIVGVVVLMHGRTWKASVAFVPQARRSPSGLSTLANQFGLAVPLGEGAQTPAFYAELVRSRSLLAAVAATRFPYRAHTGEAQGTLAEIYGLKGGTPALEVDAAVRRLLRDVQTAINAKSGTVRVTVGADTPVLADKLVRRIMELLNQFNLETRQSQAAAERRFSEQRLDAVKGELRAAEDRLQHFLQNNRDLRNSPELTFQQDRLAREVNLQQQLYASLAQAYEQARIEEVRDTPVITIVDDPAVPVRPEPRGLVLQTFLALILGGLLGLGWGLVRDRLRGVRGMDLPAADEFQRLKAEALADLRRPWRVVSRRG